MFQNFCSVNLTVTNRFLFEITFSESEADLDKQKAERGRLRAPKLNATDFISLDKNLPEKPNKKVNKVSTDFVDTIKMLMNIK